MENDNIIIPRKLLESDIFVSDNLFRVFIWCLKSAKTKGCDEFVKIGRGSVLVKLKKGELVFKRGQFSRELRLNKSAVYRSILKLIELEKLKIRVNNQYSVVTVCNIDTYIGGKSEVEQPMNNQTLPVNGCVSNDCEGGKSEVEQPNSKNAETLNNQTLSASNCNTDNCEGGKSEVEQPMNNQTNNQTLPVNSCGKDNCEGGKSEVEQPNEQPNFEDKEQKRKKRVQQQKILLSKFNPKNCENENQKNAYEIAISFHKLFVNFRNENDISTSIIDKATVSWIKDTEKLLKIAKLEQLQQIYMMFQSEIKEFNRGGGGFFWVETISSIRGIYKHFDKLILKAKKYGKNGKNKQNGRKVGCTDEELAAIMQKHVNRLEEIQRTGGKEYREEN
jgi:hypothetical protein